MRSIAGPGVHGQSVIEVIAAPGVHRQSVIEVSVDNGNINMFL